jgi:hypothetical protein
MVTILVARNINIDNVSILERTIIGNSMTNDFIDGRATGFRKSMIVER